MVMEPARQRGSSPSLEPEISTGTDERYVLPVSAFIPQQPQRQDSTTSQLVTVLAAAIRLGCYDAHDAIRAAFFDKGITDDA